MRTTFYFLISFLLACTTSVHAKNAMIISDLRCEHLTNPLGIDVETPRFSWKITDPTQTRGQGQTAYRILVASSPAKLKAGKGDVWDSGKTLSDQSHLVSYNGAKLLSGGDYYWKVMIWDNQRKTAEWSDIARFSMGLLNRTDWKGQWIKHPTAAVQQHTWFRKHLTLKDKTSSAFLYAASTGYHELYVNGQKVDERVLAPVLAHIDKRVLYVTYDIKPFLQEGDNVIAFWFAPGWSHYASFNPIMNQALLVQLNGQTIQGEKFSLCSDETWKCAESYSRNDGTFKLFNMGGELTDGRLYTTEWNKPGFDESQWTTATKITPLKDGKDVILSAQMSDPSRITESVPAVSMSDSIPKTWVVDMGKIFTGFLEALFTGLKAGDTVRMHISDRIDKFDNFSQVHYYVARGENGEMFRNNFNYFAGRYIHFTGLKQKPELKDITGYALTSAPQRTGYFECSDADYNRMYDIDRYTYEMCTNEGYSTDCPNRERLGYGAEGGWQTTWAMGLPCFSSGAFYIKNIRDWTDAMHPDGRMNHVTPQNMESAGGVLYGSGFLNIAWEHYLAYGDKTILEQVYNDGKIWLDYLNEHIYDGLLYPYNGDGYNFLGDWVGPGYRLEIGNSARSHIFNNCYYAISLDYIIQIANSLGHADETQPYLERLKKIRKRIHEKYYDPFMHYYLNGDQIRTTFPLYAGVVPDDLKPEILDHLKADMTGAHPFFDIGSPSRMPYFRTLFAHPEFHNIIAGILSKKTSPGYGYFLETGETTWPEVWELDTHSARVHTSFVGISCWFIKGLAGIEPDTIGPGYRSFDLRPNVTDNLSYAKAGLESPYGLIESGWRKDGDKIIYDINVPIGSTANIHLPATVSRITEGGKPLDKATGIRITEEQAGSVLIQAVSGKYSFEVK